MAKKKRMTAEDILAELEADPEYVAHQQAQDREIERQEAASARAQAPLLRDLKAAGADLNTVWDLVNTRRKYPQLVPVLLKHLDRKYPEKIREGIARALAVPDARIGWKQLLRAFSAEPALDEQGNPSQVKWALHLAIAAAADASGVHDLVALTANRRHGENRSYFVDALARIDSPQARAALEELKGDPDLEDAFKRLRKRKARRQR
jgi:hypothetical protein